MVWSDWKKGKSEVGCCLIKKAGFHKSCKFGSFFVKLGDEFVDFLALEGCSQTLNY